MDEEIKDTAPKPRLFNGTEWIEFNTVEEHDLYISSMYEGQTKSRSVEQDIDFGKVLILEYLNDNRKVYLSTTDSIAQMQKFSSLKSLLEVGALRPAKDILSIAEIDQIFTQERKDKYLSMLTGFLQ